MPALPKEEEIGLMISCSECRFWLHMPNDASTGQCRFNPPVVLYATAQGTQGAEYPDTHFPVTYALQWCGKAEAHVAPELCESCTNADRQDTPAVTRDASGVPLCKVCMDGLIADAAGI